MKNKKILSLTLAAALAAGIMQTSVFAAPATRAEALRTIIQTIGKESDALSETAENPFTDVPEQADRYAAYAYKNGIVSGVGDNRFEADRAVTADEYTIMLERAKKLADTADENTVKIAEQGMFSSGGTVTEPVEGKFDETTNWLDGTRAGNTAHIDHANVLCQIPENETELPMVFLHGYGQSRMGWMTTPDGREGWSTSFLRKGHGVFLVDQPRRGEAGSTASMTNDGIDTWSAESKEYMPGDQAWYTHFRIGRASPERYEGSQFPEGEEAQNQFFRQMTPNTGSFDLAVNVAAIVAIEPGGTPEIGSEQYNKFLAAKTPIVIYFGDYIDNGPSDIQSTSFWKAVRNGAVAFAESYNKDGGNCTVINLPDIGITGNSHFMFQEKNS